MSDSLPLPSGFAAANAGRAPAGDDQRNTMGSRLTSRLRESILQGDLQPGLKINLDRLRSELDVSLSPLREALARLIAEGLVVFEDNRGYHVAPVSLANLTEITTLRADFEALALGHAIERADAEWERDVMRALHRLSRIDRDPAVPATMEAWESAHSNLHLTLIAGCNMPLLLSFTGVLLNLNDRYRRIFLRANSGDRNVKGEHSDIAQAAVARDRDYAVSKLREHIARTGANLRDALSDELTARQAEFSAPKRR